MDTIHIDTCPICGSQHLEEAGTCVDHYATGESFKIWKCRTCRFRFTQDFPDETVNARYYDSPDYISHSDTRQGMMNKIYHWARTVMLRRKRRLVSEATGLKRGHLLDIGSGTGYFAHEMKKIKWTVTAAEKSPNARQFAQQHFSIDHLVTPEQLEDIADGTFDAVTMWHVMEHVQRLDHEWALVNRLLKPEGIFLMAVPNFESADGSIYGTNWAAYDVPRHLWHFNSENVHTLATRHGFKMLEKHPMPLDAFFISILSERYAGTRHAFLQGMSNGLKCYFKAGGRPELSSSIIYVMKKKKNG